MTETRDDSFQLRMRVLVFWILYVSVIAYILLTLFLVYQRGGSVQVTLIFVEPMTNIMGIILVVLYFTVELFLTWFFYRRARKASPDKGYVYALAAVIIGVTAPYTYGLLLSFMGIMRDILPILYIAILYLSGIVVGIRIIPAFSVHQYER